MAIERVSVAGHRWRTPICADRQGAILVTLIVLAMGFAGLSRADEGKWTLRLEPIYVAAYGHDRHVLSVHEYAPGSGFQPGSGLAVDLETESVPTWRAEFRYERASWGLGADVFVFLTSQDAADQAHTSSSSEAFSYEVPDRIYSTDGPNETLYYRVLGDTDLEVWNVDLYATRLLSDRPASRLRLRFGLRLGDFDNDYHAAVGVQGGGGSQLDSSSNYELMMGPLVGLDGEIERGKSTFEAHLGQSLIFGDATLSRHLSDFEGPHPPEEFSAVESFERSESVSIPISEFRFRWIYHFTDAMSAGLGADTSVWWNVPVPPGVELEHPRYQENTITFFGLLALFELSF